MGVEERGNFAAEVEVGFCVGFYDALFVCFAAFSLLRIELVSSWLVRHIKMIDVDFNLQKSMVFKKGTIGHFSLSNDAWDDFIDNGVERISMLL